MRTGQVDVTKVGTVLSDLVPVRSVIIFFWQHHHTGLGVVTKYTPRPAWGWELSLISMEEIDSNCQPPCPPEKNIICLNTELFHKKMLPRSTQSTYF